MTQPARVACRPFKQPELYRQHSIGGEEMGALLPYLLPGRGQPLFLSGFQVPSLGRGLPLKVCLWSSGTVPLITVSSSVVSL